MQIALESPAKADVWALVEALDAYQRPLYPPESHHGIDLAALQRPEVLFAVLRDAAGLAIGCGALLLQADHSAELKRLFLQPASRGGGRARALLNFLEAQGRARGCRRVQLETGIHQPAALALYAAAGYRRRGPFGSYADDPNSVFMEKPL